MPAADRTRSGLCGARVGGAPLPWPAGPWPASAPPAPEVRDAPGPCPECAALLVATAA